MKTFKRGLGCSVVALLFCFVTPCHAIDITLAWDANTEPNLAGYKVYYDTDCSGAPYNGAGAAEDDSPIDVGNVTEFTLHGLSDDDVYFFVVTAYNDEGLESGYSNEVSTQCSLTLNTAGSGNVGLDPAGGSYDVGTEVELEALPEPGWQFSGWSGDLTGSGNPVTITMDSNKTVTAIFTEVPHAQYILTVNTTGSGSVIPDPAGGTYDAGTIVTLTAQAESGWQFSNWSGDLTGSSNPATITMDTNKAVTAAFTQTPPVINTFTATPNTINEGEFVTLEWNITGADSATIDNGVGAVPHSSGSVQDAPPITTTYTLTATNSEGSVTSTVTVTVEYSPSSPVINSFIATPETINEGESPTLSWSINDADSATIDNDIGPVDPVSSSLEVSPLTTTTYTLTAINGGGSVASTVTVTVLELLPPEIIETIPHNGAGINDNTRVSNKTSFCVRIEDSDGIDITDPTSVRFTIDDDLHAEYTRDLNDLSVVRVVKLTEEDDTQVTRLWVAYDRPKEDEFEGYDFDTLINIKVDIKDRAGQEMEQEIFSIKIETEAEHENAEATSPSTAPVDPSDPDLADPEYFYDAGIEVISGGLKGGKIIYNSNEPVIPIFGPIEEIPGLGADNEGTAMNLQPPTVFNTPVKVFIPYPGYSDVSDLSIFLYT
ncbi:MAG: hypothetical protein L6406_12725, partial [Desulfobacterales bacterium]|nr:hypothetical protein [Desulfobacterales bacterium]